MAKQVASYVSFGSWRLGDQTRAEAVWGILFKDPARSAAIVAGIMVEDSLEKKLKSTLRNSSVFDSLFGLGRPLHFFGQRNQLAYLMRIYGKPFYQELETIASIRNRFAHLYVDKKSGQPIKNFKSPTIKELCGKLMLMEHLERLEEERRERLGLRISRGPSWAKSSEPLEALKQPRIRYIRTCGLCVSALNDELDPKNIEVIWADELSSPGIS